MGRQRLGLTQEQLGVSLSTVNVWENGKRAPLSFLRQRLLEMANDAGLPAAASRIDSPRRRSRR